MGRGVGSEIELAGRRRVEHVDEHSAPRRWTDIVKPGMSVGPSQARDGFEILVAEKAIEIEESETATFRFSIAGWRWQNGWQRQPALSDQEVSEIVGPLQRFWPATSDVSMIASAWFEFTNAVERHNRVSWARRGGDLRLGSSALAQQLRAADLLDGPTVIVGDIETIDAPAAQTDFLAQPARALDDSGHRRVIKQFTSEFELRIRRYAEAWDVDATHSISDIVSDLQIYGLFSSRESDPRRVLETQLLNLIERLPEGGYDRGFNIELVADWILRRGDNALETIDRLIVGRLNSKNGNRRGFFRRNVARKEEQNEEFTAVVRSLPKTTERSGWLKYDCNNSGKQKELWRAS